MPSKTDIIEALLFASDRPVPLKKLANIVELSESDTLEELAALREEKSHIGALQVLEVAGGWQVVTKPEFARHIARLRDEKRQKLSRAAFEVLAIVAYRQPATRADIESLRGVDCAGSLQFLLEKKLLAFAGRKDAPGRPWLYATTPQFLDHFGLRSVEDMPSLAELVELSDDATQAQTRSLFSRGAMTAMDETRNADDTAHEPETAEDTSRIRAHDFQNDAARNGVDFASGNADEEENAS
jgi:segregation and condensation protein B